MRIFLDSSKVEGAKRWSPVIDGATTNPSILLKDGSDIYEFCRYMNPKPVSVEVGTKPLSEAMEYHQKIPNVVVKVPLLRTDKAVDNLEVIKTLSEEGVKINCTALMSLSQVILATKCGARYVSLFAGRVDDEGGDYYSMISDCRNFLDDESGETELIVGSVRTVGNVLDAVRAGAHIVTIPPAILEKMLLHSRSLSTVKEFERDYEKLSGLREELDARRSS